MSNRKTQLLEIVEELETLAVEAEELRVRVSAAKAEAKGRGFSVKVVASILKLRRMTPEARAEYEGLLDLYKADLGMLDGTPLGKYARDRMAKEKKPEEEAKAGAPAPEDPPEPEAPPPPTLEEIQAAREAGGAAFAQGKDVLANPFGAADARRAAWDEGFCAAAGSDGMDIPDAWRPAKPQKKDGSKGGGA